jgi:hypothetical protein
MSAFWYSQRQRRAVRKIAAVSDLVLTNTGVHAAWLNKQPAEPGVRPVQVLSVFSAVGERQVNIPMSQRQRAMVVFGLGGTRQKAYKDLASLPDILSHLGIVEIVDIGPDPVAPQELHGLPIRRMGELKPADLVLQLARAQFGFISYDIKCLAKSSVFASYCAQGVVTVIDEPFDAEVDGLRDGIHFLSRRTAKTVPVSELDQCSSAAWQWYQDHRLGIHASTYAQWLGLSANDAGINGHTLSA